VRFLEEQTASIDRAADAARREIELLKEFRTRLIADVVTGKLDVREVAAGLPDEPPEGVGEELDAEEETSGAIAEEETSGAIGDLDEDRFEPEMQEVDL